MKQYAKGFTLIELMITVTIALVVTVALIEIYSSTRQTNQIQAMQARLTEDGRFALSMVQRVISQAGFRQSPATPIPTDRLSPSATNPTTAVAVKFEPDGANMMICDGSTSAAVMAGNPITLTIAQNGTKLECQGATTVEWVAPTAGTGSATELADFKIGYGVDTGPTTPQEYGCGPITGTTRPRDCIADGYQDSLTGTQTAEQIVSVKVCLILRTQATHGTISKTSAVKNCSGGDISGSQNDHKLYRAFRSTILLRNR